MISPLGQRLCALAALTLSALAGPAAADQDSERYVGVNAQDAISALSKAGAPSEISANFGKLMDAFTDVSDLSSNVLGAYAREIKRDPTANAAWTAAFRDYSMAVYEDQLNKYRGSTVVVLGSRDADLNGRRCSRVSTQVDEPSPRKQVRLYWYLCKTDSGAWRMSDIGLDAGGGEIKVLLTQRAQFESVLSRNGGDFSKLTALIQARTAAIRGRIGLAKRQ
jgi:phospholipid transport system substrate-binding protein